MNIYDDLYSMVIWFVFLKTANANHCIALHCTVVYCGQKAQPPLFACHGLAILISLVPCELLPMHFISKKKKMEQVTPFKRYVQ